MACVLALLTGCNGDTTDSEALPTRAPSSTEPSSAGPPTPSGTAESTAAAATPQEEAAANAEQTVRDYIAFTDELVADGTIDLKGLDAFLQNPELTDRRDFFQRFRDQGFYSKGGSTTFESVKATKVKIEPKTGEATVSLKVCLNLAEVDVRKKSGEPLDLLSPALGTFEVYNYDYPDSKAWKIAVETAPGKRCGA